MDMGSSPKDAATKTAPALDDDLDLEPSDTDAVAGGHRRHAKTKVGKDSWKDAKCLPNE
jgi:hypothetical protein